MSPETVSLKVAQYSDLENLIPMSVEFVNFAYPTQEIDLLRVRETLSSLILGTPHNSIILLGYVNDSLSGMISGALAPCMWNLSKTTIELWWWVDPKARQTSVGQELRTAFEHWSKSIVKADRISMASLAHSRDQALDRIYRRNGFEKIETTYVKEL